MQSSAVSRRHASTLVGAGLLAPAFVSAQSASVLPLDRAERDAFVQAQMRDLEVTSQGRLGVYILDVATGRSFAYRADERFMMLSSFKLLASALVLHRIDAGLESLDRRMPYKVGDLIPWSPITEKHADGQGLTLARLCEATLTTSDNTAANLILSSFGGPAALTAFARRLGDPVTRLDRNEPTLNTPTADILMDTTSPRAMVTLMQKLLVGNALSARSRALLQEWLRGNTTGNQRLKAGLPIDWRIGDKTGANKTDANDVAIVYPPNKPPLLVAAYLADSQASSQAKDATLVRVGTWVQAIGD